MRPTPLPSSHTHRPFFLPSTPELPPQTTASSTSSARRSSFPRPPGATSPPPPGRSASASWERGSSSSRETCVARGAARPPSALAPTAPDSRGFGVLREERAWLSRLSWTPSAPAAAAEGDWRGDDEPADGRVRAGGGGGGDPLSSAGERATEATRCCLPGPLGVSSS